MRPSPGEPRLPASSVNLPADDGQWLMAAKDYANTRFSGLTEINAENNKWACTVFARQPETGEAIWAYQPGEVLSAEPFAYPSTSEGVDLAHTGLLYVPHQNLCQDFEGTEVSYIEGTPYVGANVKMYAGPGGNRGIITAARQADHASGRSHRHAARVRHRHRRQPRAARAEK